MKLHQGQHIGFVNSYRHLGVEKSQRAQESQHRAASARQAFRALSAGVFASGHLSKKRQDLGRISLRCNALSPYGAGTWEEHTVSSRRAINAAYYSARNQFERFRGVWELTSRFEFDFRRRGFFFERFEFFGVFKVQSHTMWPYMCMCCGLFVPTQFHFDCCGVRDDS